MTLYKVALERSAVEIVELTIAAHNMDNAVLIAQQEMERPGFKPRDKRVQSVDDPAFFGDDESVWEESTVEEVPS